VARLFVAVWPPAEILDRVAALPRAQVDGLRWTDRRQWHVTLRFLGRVDDVASAAAALEGMDPVSRPEAVLGPTAGRFGRRVVHVPVSGLEGVADAVASATADVGLPPEDRPFTGHLTLARAKGTEADIGALTGGVITGRWTVDEVCLVESRLSAAGADYAVVGRFPLGS